MTTFNYITVVISSNEIKCKKKIIKCSEDIKIGCLPCTRKKLKKLYKENKSQTVVLF